MAEATGFTSQYAGSEIEQATSAYLNGNPKTTATVSVSATTQYWKTSDVSSAKYNCVSASTNFTFEAGVTNNYTLVASSSRGKRTS